MMYKSKKAPFSIRLSIACLIVVSLVAGCNSGKEGKTSLPLEVLPDIELLPKPEQTSDSTSSESYINIISSDVELNFPQALTFNLAVESNHKITDIELLYESKKILSSSVMVTVQLDFKPGTLVETDWTWDTRKSSLPPGAQIEYSWVIENDSGDRVETEPTILIFDDGHHDWQEMADENIRLFWYERDRSFGQELMETAQQALETLAENTGTDLEGQARIYIYATTQDLHDALVYPDEWTGGMAFPDHGVIVIGIATNNLSWGKRAVTHELSHLVIHQVTYSPLSNIPAWLDEGLAMYSEGDLLWNFEHSLQEAVSNDALFSIPSISGSFPSDRDKAELAYAQSYSLVEYLLNNYSDRSTKTQQLLQAFSNGASIDDALLEVYGVDSKQLEKDWRDNL